jgi:hypothetical protein
VNLLLVLALALIPTVTTALIVVVLLGSDSLPLMIGVAAIFTIPVVVVQHWLRRRRERRAAHVEPLRYRP